MKPVICLITDRRRLGPDAASRLVMQVAAAARAGVQLVQVRERDLDGGALTRLVRACVTAVGHTSARVIVNDRIDVAIASGAHGVHLRADSVAAARVRDIVPDRFLLGRSIHSVAEAREADREGALDYLIFGTVFPTPSKATMAAAGVDALAEVVAATTLPVLAVGGITPHTATRIAHAGATGIAAITLFANDADEGMLRQVVSSLNIAFDTRSGVS